ARLGRVLQERRFGRLGEDKTREVDSRLIAATNRDRRQEVAAGRFRGDLYCRLNVFPIECTPLRERGSDIPILAEHFLKTTAARLNMPKPTLTNANIETLAAYAWPGNARELQNVIERAVILARHGRLHVDLPSGPAETATSAAQRPARRLPGDGEFLTAAQMAAFERENIERALTVAGGKVAGKDGAAALLAMKPTTLYSKIKALGIEARRGS
ncbi:MAG: sigma 54-interacting transcriptional regulator, partial [Kiloniellaceae bacterium]